MKRGVKMDEDEWKLIKKIFWGVAGLVLVIIVLSGLFYTIKSGEEGVLFTFGKASIIARGPGFHIKIPLVQSVVKFDVRTMKYEEDASAASSDLQDVFTKVAINYHLIRGTTPGVFSELGVTYETKVIQPYVSEIVKAVTAKFTAEELITKRESVREEIQRILTDRLLVRNIQTEQVSITNFQFSKAFTEAIEAKVTAEQNALAAKNKLEQVKFEAQQRIEEAKGKADAMAIEIQSLRQNKDILQLRAIEKWDGVMPLVTGGAMPFISLPEQTAKINEPVVITANITDEV